jgi:alkanesulfonate monooxygenase SsuD/methylene tetrahydromethanopterin reductase-like flavin-dependent oxidoreductase (luciferase family)
MLDPNAGLTIMSGHLGFDLSTIDIDVPIDGLDVPGVQSLVAMYEKSSTSSKLTIRDIGKAHANGSVPQVIGTAEQIADWMADTMEVVGGDGFLLSPVYLPGSIDEFVESVVPELQRRGLVREEYIDGTLRDNLMAF